VGSSDSLGVPNLGPTSSAAEEELAGPSRGSRAASSRGGVGGVGQGSNSNLAASAAQAQALDTQNSDGSPDGEPPLVVQMASGAAFTVVRNSVVRGVGLYDPKVVRAMPSQSTAAAATAAAATAAGGVALPGGGRREAPARPPQLPGKLRPSGGGPTPSAGAPKEGGSVPPSAAASETSVRSGRRGSTDTGGDKSSRSDDASDRGSTHKHKHKHGKKDKSHKSSSHKHRHRRDKAGVDDDDGGGSTVASGAGKAPSSSSSSSSKRRDSSLSVKAPPTPTPGPGPGDSGTGAASEGRSRSRQRQTPATIKQQRGASHSPESTPVPSLVVRGLPGDMARAKAAGLPDTSMMAHHHHHDSGSTALGAGTERSLTELTAGSAAALLLHSDTPPLSPSILTDAASMRAVADATSRAAAVAMGRAAATGSAATMLPRPAIQSTSSTFSRGGLDSLQGSRIVDEAVGDGTELEVSPMVSTSVAGEADDASASASSSTAAIAAAAIAATAMGRVRQPVPSALLPGFNGQRERGRSGGSTASNGNGADGHRGSSSRILADGTAVVSTRRLGSPSPSGDANGSGSGTGGTRTPVAPAVPRASASGSSGRKLSSAASASASGVAFIEKRGRRGSTSSTSSKASSHDRSRSHSRTGETA
jgi:hypothetical protein